MEVKSTAGAVSATTLFDNVYGHPTYGASTAKTEVCTNPEQTASWVSSTNGVPVEVYCDTKHVAPVVALFDASAQVVTLRKGRSAPIEIKANGVVRAACLRVAWMGDRAVVASLVGSEVHVVSVDIGTLAEIHRVVEPDSLLRGAGWREFANTAAITRHKQLFGIVVGDHVATEWRVQKTGDNNNGSSPAPITASCRLLSSGNTALVCGLESGNVWTPSFTGTLTPTEASVATFVTKFNAAISGEGGVFKKRVVALAAYTSTDSVQTAFVLYDGGIARWRATNSSGADTSAAVDVVEFSSSEPAVIGLQPQTSPKDGAMCFVLRHNSITKYDESPFAAKIVQDLPGARGTAFAAVTIPAATHVYVGHSDGSVYKMHTSHMTLYALLSTHTSTQPVTHVACCCSSTLTSFHIVVIVHGGRIDIHARQGSNANNDKVYCIGYHDVASIAATQTPSSSTEDCVVDVVDTAGVHIAYPLTVSNATGDIAEVGPPVVTSPPDKGSWPLTVCSNADKVSLYATDRVPVTRAAAVAVVDLDEHKSIAKTHRLTAHTSSVVLQRNGNRAACQVTFKSDYGLSGRSALTIEIDSETVSFRNGTLTLANGEWTFVGDSFSFTFRSANPAAAVTLINNSTSVVQVEVTGVEDVIDVAVPARSLDAGLYDASMDITESLAVLAGHDDAAKTNVVMYGYGCAPINSAWSTNPTTVGVTKITDKIKDDTKKFRPGDGSGEEDWTTDFKSKVVKSGLGVRVGLTLDSDNKYRVNVFGVAVATGDAATGAISEKITDAAQTVFSEFDSVQRVNKETQKDDETAQQPAAIPAGMLQLNRDTYGSSRDRGGKLEVVGDVGPLRVERAVFLTADLGATAYGRTSVDDDAKMTRSQNQIQVHQFLLQSDVFPSQPGSADQPLEMEKPAYTGGETWRSEPSFKPSAYTQEIKAETENAVAISRLGQWTAMYMHNKNNIAPDVVPTSLYDIVDIVFKLGLFSGFLDPALGVRFKDPTSWSASTNVLDMLEKCMIRDPKRSGGTLAGDARSIWGQYNQCNIEIDEESRVTGYAPILYRRYACDSSSKATKYTMTPVSFDGEDTECNARTVTVGEHTVVVTTGSTKKTGEADEWARCTIDGAVSAKVDFTTPFTIDAAFSDEISKPCVLANGSRVKALFTVGENVFVAGWTGGRSPACTLSLKTYGTFENVFVAASATRCVVLADVSATSVTCTVHTATNAGTIRNHPISGGVSCIAMHTLRGVDYLAIARFDAGTNKEVITFYRVDDECVHTALCGEHRIECIAHETSKECTTKRRLPNYQTAPNLKIVSSTLGGMGANDFKRRSPNADDSNRDNYNKVRAHNAVGIARELSAMNIVPNGEDATLTVALAWTYFIETTHSSAPTDPIGKLKVGDQVCLMPGVIAFEDDIPATKRATVKAVGNDTLTLDVDGSTYTPKAWHAVRYQRVRDDYTPFQNDALNFTYSVHTESLKMQLRCDDGEAAVDRATHVNAGAAAFVSARSDRPVDVEVYESNLTLAVNHSASPGAFWWGERKTNQNYVTNTHTTIDFDDVRFTATIDPPAEATERYSDMFCNLKFLTGVTNGWPLQQESTLLNKIKATYACGAKDIKYAAKFNAVTTTLVPQNVGRPPVESPYKPNSKLMLTVDSTVEDVAFMYGGSTLEPNATLDHDTTVKFYRVHNTDHNYISSFIACFLKNEPMKTMSIRWDETSSDNVPAAFKSRAINNENRSYLKVDLNVNSVSYYFWGSVPFGADTPKFDNLEWYDQRIASTQQMKMGEVAELTLAQKWENQYAYFNTFGQGNPACMTCVAQYAIPERFCVYSLVYLAGSVRGTWPATSNAINSVATAFINLRLKEQATKMADDECPHAFYLVRKWSIDGVDYPDTAFMVQLPIQDPTSCRVQAMDVDDTGITLILRNAGGGRVRSEKYSSNLSLAAHARALACTIRANPDTDTDLDMKLVVEGVAKAATDPRDICALVQAVGRQYEYRRNKSDEEPPNKTETAMIADDDQSNLELYYSVENGDATPYVLDPDGVPNEVRSLYRLRGCKPYATATVSKGLWTATAPTKRRYLAPELSLWSEDETANRTCDNTMRPVQSYGSNNSSAVPDYERFMESTLQRQNRTFEKYNAACGHITINENEPEWFVPVGRTRIVCKRNVSSTVLTPAEMSSYMPPLPSEHEHEHGHTLCGYRGVGCTTLLDNAFAPTVRLVSYRTAANIPRTFNGDPPRMTNMARQLCDLIANEGVVPILSFVVQLAETEDVHAAHHGRFTEVKVNNTTFCVSADSFAVTLSSNAIRRASSIHDVFGKKLGPLYDSEHKLWPNWLRSKRTSVVVELNSTFSAFVVSGHDLSGATPGATYTNESDTETLKLRERTTDNVINWTVDVASNAAFLAIVTGSNRADARIHVLHADGIYQMVENNVLLHFASHVACFATNGTDHNCVVLHTPTVKRGVYTFAELFAACKPEMRNVFKTGTITVSGTLHTIAIKLPESVSINIDTGFNASTISGFNWTEGFSCTGQPRSGTEFPSWETVCVDGLVCQLRESTGPETRNFVSTTGLAVALHKADADRANRTMTYSVDACVVGRRADQQEHEHCHVNSRKFGKWCANKFAGFFYPDHKFVQTGIRAVFVKNTAYTVTDPSTDNEKLPYTQIHDIIATLRASDSRQAGSILVEPPIAADDDMGPLKEQTIPESKRSALYRLLITAPKEFPLVVPVTVSLSGHAITPTYMNVEGWYVLTPRMFQAASVIRHEVGKVLRRGTTVTAAECCNDITAFGEAVVDQALINIQTLDSGLHFKDRSALKLSTHQRKAAVYRIAMAIKNNSNPANTERCLPRPAPEAFITP